MNNTTGFVLTTSSRKDWTSLGGAAGGGVGATAGRDGAAGVAAAGALVASCAHDREKLLDLLLGFVANTHDDLRWFTAITRHPFEGIHSDRYPSFEPSLLRLSRSCLPYRSLPG